MSGYNFGAFPDDATRFGVLENLDAFDVLYSGWIPPEARTQTENQACAHAQAGIPDLQITGRSVYATANHVGLWECWSARKGGWPGIRQVTGSCVGAGGGNALFSLACADVIKRRDPERVEVPFWLLPYGVSRMLGGLNDRGDGSFGTTFAQAVREYGHLPANEEGLPTFDDNDGLVWGKEAELNWSQGKKIPESYLEQSRKFLVRTTAKCRNTDDVRDALLNYYPVACASNWGGAMRPTVKGDGDRARLLNTRRTNWMHQMFVAGWENHPQFGELFYLFNTWGQNAHGKCPSGAPPGGFWINQKDMQDIVSQNETFAFSQFSGFPAVDTPLDFTAF
jgi:hypothetical protein